MAARRLSMTAGSYLAEAEELLDTARKYSAMPNVNAPAIEALTKLALAHMHMAEHVVGWSHLTSTEREADRYRGILLPPS